MVNSLWVAFGEFQLMSFLQIMLESSFSAEVQPHMFVFLNSGFETVLQNYGFHDRSSEALQRTGMVMAEWYRRCCTASVGLGCLALHHVTGQRWVFYGRKSDMKGILDYREFENPCS